MGRRDPSSTPLMQQFRDVKARYPHAIVFFRLGDFYEMFYDDAIEASKLLDLTLTTRDKGRDDAVPMCGVPHHAASGYIAKLTAAGRSVVVCEQVEDPKVAKGIVRRDVVRMVTPGITTDDTALDPNAACYVACVLPADEGFGFAYLDVSTGEFVATAVVTEADLISELVRIAPREVLAPLDVKGPRRDRPWERLQKRWPVPWTPVVPATPPFDGLRGLLPPEGAQLATHVLGAAATVLGYARATQMRGVLSMSPLRVVTSSTSVGLDATAIRTLELFETMIGNRRDGSLLGAIDCTVSAGGARLLRQWLARPSADLDVITARHEAVGWLVAQPTALALAREALADVYDVERIVARACLEQATPPELVRLRRTLQAAQGVRKALAESEHDTRPPLLADGVVGVAAIDALAELLQRALDDRAPRLLRDGGTIAAGYDATVDELRDLCSGGASLLTQLEATERARTGIGNLKIGRSRVFGFFLEVSKSQVAKVPADFVRRQTVASGERYVTAALAELELKLQSAEEKLLAREQELFGELATAVVAGQTALLELARWLSTFDVLAGFAEVARKRRYVRPLLGLDERLEIRDGRHPVVEAALARQAALAPGTAAFVSNDCVLSRASAEPESGLFLLVTGPNMAGKSTYMRQVALIVLLAQCGSFVPARSAYIGLIDRLFTRIGAADDLARGDSTFMVEMRETAAILQGATPRSLVLLDEIGRGTSTYDGLAIAWAVAEHLAQTSGARTLFATHYHELCRLADQIPGIRNVSMAVGDQGGELTFLRKVVAGEAARSYGVEVAKRAGLPQGVLRRAAKILNGLQQSASMGARGAAQLSLSVASEPAVAQQDCPYDGEDRSQQPLWASSLLTELARISTDTMTPVQAITKLHELASRARAELGPMQGRESQSPVPYS